MRHSMFRFTCSRSVTNWTYPEGSSIATVYNATSKKLSYSASSAWASVGMLLGHSSIKIGANVFWSGGLGTVP